jgi:hypothetical protein
MIFMLLKTNFSRNSRDADHVSAFMGEQSVSTAKLHKTAYNWFTIFEYGHLLSSALISHLANFAMLKTIFVYTVMPQLLTSGHAFSLLCNLVL